MAKLVIGCGYLGLRAAQRWREAGCAVYAVTRSAHRARVLTEHGLYPLVADVTQPSSLASLPAASTLLYAVGYDAAANPSLVEVYIDGLRNVLESLPAAIKRIIYVSSTGVYGGTEGRWVVEDSPCEPIGERGQVCLAAENLLRGHELGRRAIILRMAGLYGPGRIPLRRDLAAGKPIAVPTDGFVNLIHVDDAAEAILAAELRAPLPSLYCVSDGHPVTRADYYRHLATRIGAPEPRFVPPENGSPVARRAASCKRVSNARLLKDLTPAFRFPSYREGLGAIVEAERVGPNQGTGNSDELAVRRLGPGRKLGRC